MRAVASAALALIACIAISGCSKAAFTQGVREQFGLTREDLRRIQFFNSDTIVLQREVEAQSRSLKDNELVMRGGVLVEQVKVSERTPCVALRVEGDFMLMGFSPKDPRAALWFRAQRDDDLERAPERRYELVALDNPLVESGAFEPRYSKGFLVTWGGAEYHVTAGREAYLLYDLDHDFERDMVEQSAPGWRLSEQAAPRTPAGEVTPPLQPTPQQSAPPDAGLPDYDEL